VQMTIRRTFIELVAKSPRRARALTDSALDEKREWSDASTDAPSDHEDASPVHWPSVQHEGCDAFGMPFPMGGAPLYSTCVAMDGTTTWAHGAGMLPGCWWFANGHEGDATRQAALQWPWPDHFMVDAGLAAEGFGSEAPSAAACAGGAEASPVPAGAKTTVMLRNLPSGYMRSSVVELLEDEGLDGSFDFVYLPMDFGNNCCLGYAFVNFLSAADALRCWRIFEGFTEWGRPSEKVCEVSWSDPQQGLAANIERYRNSPVMHQSVPEEWKPAIFQAGTPVMFPTPTKTIKAPKMRCRPSACGATTRA